MFTGPVGPVEVFFHWPKDHLGEFLLAWGQPLTVSIKPCKNTRIENGFKQGISQGFFRSPLHIEYCPKILCSHEPIDSYQM